MPPQRINEILESRAAGVKQISLIVIVDAHGIPLYRSRGGPRPDLNVSDRSYFLAQRDDAANGSFISEPLVTRSENRAAVVLSRRLTEGKRSIRRGGHRHGRP